MCLCVLGELSYNLLNVSVHFKLFWKTLFIKKNFKDMQMVIKSLCQVTAKFLNTPYFPYSLLWTGKQQVRTGAGLWITLRRFKASFSAAAILTVGGQVTHCRRGLSCALYDAEQVPDLYPLEARISSPSLQLWQPKKVSGHGQVTPAG